MRFIVQCSVPNSLLLCKSLQCIWARIDGPCGFGLSSVGVYSFNQDPWIQSNVILACLEGDKVDDDYQLWWWVLVIAFSLFAAFVSLFIRSWSSSQIKRRRRTKKRILVVEVLIWHHTCPHVSKANLWFRPNEVDPRVSHAHLHAIRRHKNFLRFWGSNNSGRCAELAATTCTSILDNYIDYEPTK